MASVHQIATALRASREEFGRLFLRAQFNANLSNRILFDGITTNIIDDKDAFIFALRRAELEGWLENFIAVAIEEQLEDGSLIAETIDHSSNATLQGITNYVRLYGQPEIAKRGIANAMKWTCKIIVNNKAAGTGILIGPNLVLTAWHVVKGLFDPAESSDEYIPKAFLPGALKVEFEDYFRFTNKGEPNLSQSQIVKAHKNSWVAFRHCTAPELSNKLPPNLLDLEGYWDYAVFRLEQVVGLERNWALAEQRSIVPRSQEDATLFQHPNGDQLTYDIHRIDEYNPPRIIPSLRFIHTANATTGSSGGPFFDKSFSFFGLHQGIWSKNGNVIKNRGVPLSRILEHINKNFGPLPAPDISETFIWKIKKQGLIDDQPVIGCDSFQQLIWDSSISGVIRLITIDGKTGSGKNFRTLLMDEMLRDASHLKIKESASSFSKLDPIAFVKRIESKYNIPFADIVPMEQYHATVTTWLRDEVVTKFIQGMNTQRNGRKVWITLYDLQDTIIEGRNLAEFLLILYESIVGTEWLRIVLVGFAEDIPLSIQSYTARHTAQNFTEDQIKQYLDRYGAATDQSFDTAQSAGFAFSFYEAALNANGGKAKVNLINTIVGVLKKLA